MKYLQKSFQVPAAGPGVTEAEWNRIFRKETKMMPRQGSILVQEPTAYGMAVHLAQGEPLSRFVVRLIVQEWNNTYPKEQFHLRQRDGKGRPSFVVEEVTCPPSN